MSARLERTFTLDSPPDHVMDAIRDPATIEESERSRDALQVKVTELRRTDAAHEYEVMTVTYSRGVTGIDKSKTDENRNRIQWDLKSRRGTWTWQGPHGPKVKVKGSYDVKAEGAGTRLTLAVEIDVGIPLVGRVVEGKVRDAFEENWPKWVDIVRKHARGKGA